MEYHGKEKQKGSGGGTSRRNNNKLAVMKLSTDAQSVAARERRHRISERFKILQSLVPGGSKMDTVSMLEEAIHYVKFLKTQIWLHQTIIMSTTTTTCVDCSGADTFSGDHHTFNVDHHHHHVSYAQGFAAPPLVEPAAGFPNFGTGQCDQGNIIPLDHDATTLLY